jgi:hypothetical protein
MLHEMLFRSWDTFCTFTLLLLLLLSSSSSSYLRRNTNLFYIKSVWYSPNFKISHRRHVCNSLAINNTAFRLLVIRIAPKAECGTFMQLPICVTFYKKVREQKLPLFFFKSIVIQILGPWIKWCYCRFRGTP